ncbi:hypothetical protein NQ271_25675, partial [Escherichia coli]|nr:hypothetical protein [Escherichia coli]
ADRNRSHWSTSKTPSYTKSVSWQHHQAIAVLERAQPLPKPPPEILEGGLFKVKMPITFKLKE